MIRHDSKGGKPKQSLLSQISNIQDKDKIILYLIIEIVRLQSILKKHGIKYRRKKHHKSDKIHHNT